MVLQGCIHRINIFLQAEEGLCAGRVLYHSHMHKSAEEDAQQEEEIVEKERLKSERRREQVGTPNICRLVMRGEGTVCVRVSELAASLQANLEPLTP